MPPDGRPRASVVRRAYDTVEGVTGPRLAALAGNRAFAELMAAGRRVEAQWRSRGVRASASALHVWNLPAHSDLQRLVRHIARLEARLRVLEHDLEVRDTPRAAAEPADDGRPAPA